MKTGDFEIKQLKLCDRKRHAYEMKQRPNTHLRGRPKKHPSRSRNPDKRSVEYEDVVKRR